MKIKNKLLGLVLGLAVTLGVGYGLANNSSQVKVAKATEGGSTLIIDGKDLTSTATTTNTELTFGTDFKVLVSKGAKKQSVSGTNKFSENDAILIGKSGAYIYNTTAINGVITKFEIFSNKEASAKVSIGVNFSETQINKYDANTAYTATLSKKDSVYDASSKLVANAKYFWYQVTNNNNSQVQFRITYEETNLPFVSITSSTTELEVGKTFTFVAQAKNAEGATISWTSSALAVGTIDSTTGLFTALTEGKTTIRASMTYGGTEYYKEVEVNVVPTEKEYRAAKYPVVGSTYLIGYVNGETKGYYDGTMSSYYANVTDKPSKGIQITIEKEADGYLLKTSDGKYVGVVVSGTYYNFKYNDSKLYSSYILSAGTFKWTFDSTECFLAYSKTHKTGGGYVWSKLSNTDYCPLRLFEEVTVTEKTDKDVVNFFVEDYLFKNTIPTSEIGTGKCKTDGWYILAKQEYTALSDAQKTLFVSDTDFTDMLARYNAWAVANGDTTISAGALTQSSVHKDVISDNNNQTTILILSLVAITTLSIGLYFYIRKKKLAK